MKKKPRQIAVPKLSLHFLDGRVALNSGDMEKITRLYDPAAQEFSWAYGYKDKKNVSAKLSTYFSNYPDGQ